MSPFAVATFFRHGNRTPIEDVENIDVLKHLLNLKLEADFGLTSMLIVRIDGLFAKVCTRSESAHRSHHVSLMNILQKTQKDFIFHSLLFSHLTLTGFIWFFANIHVYQFPKSSAMFSQCQSL